MRALVIVVVLAGCQATGWVRGPTARAEVHVEVGFFGVPLAGAQDVVFVLDHSGSMSGEAPRWMVEGLPISESNRKLLGFGVDVVDAMRGRPHTKLAAAKAELVRTLRALPDGTRFTIVFFNEAIVALSPRLIVLDPRSREAAIAFVRGITPDGATAAVPAMRAAYTAGAARVVLLSDGLANAGGDADDLVREARVAIQAGVRIDTVGLGRDQDTALLATLAAESGGMAIRR